jgi:hypothetical protein
MQLPPGDHETKQQKANQRRDQQRRPCSVANKVKEVELRKSVMAEWLSNAIGLSESNQKGRSPGLPVNKRKFIF